MTTAIKTILMLLVTSTWAACATLNPPATITTYYEFRPYYESFLKEADKRDVELDLTHLTITGTFELLPHHQGYITHGICEKTKFSTGGIFKVLKIYMPTWKKASNTRREQLIWHELGHCLLNRAHDSRTMSFNGVEYPKSLMNAIGLPADSMGWVISKRLRRYYIDELFSERVEADKIDWSHDL